MASTTKYKKYRTFYLPKVIVDYLFIRLSENKPNDELDVAILISIINEILTKSNQNRKNEDYPYHVHPLDSRYLKAKYGDKYFKHIRWLDTSSFTIWSDKPYKGRTTHYYLQDFSYYKNYCDNYFLTNNTYTYCIPNNLDLTLKDVVNKGIEDVQKNRIYKEWCSIKLLITKSNIKFLTYQYEKDSIGINNAAKHIKKMGSHFRKNLKVHRNEAITYCELFLDEKLAKAKTEEEKNKAYKRYSTRIASVEAIEKGKNNKTLRFSRNTTNNRLDTNLTNMASDLRPFIVGYENMSYLDLKNSQPVLCLVSAKSELLKA